MSITGILFDLDGTLADTAPDLVAVLNRLLAEADRPPMPYAIARNEVSHGALGLIRLGFGLPPNAPVDEDLRQRFLDLYLENGHKNSSLFISIEYLSDAFSDSGLRWGVVTNKPAFLTEPLLDSLGVRGHLGSVVSGDTLPQRKPDPAPLELAARELGAPASACIYLGDAERDIQAGRSAGMRTIATSYGYVRPGEDVAGWNADAIVDHPSRIPSMLERMRRTG